MAPTPGQLHPCHAQPYLPLASLSSPPTAESLAPLPHPRKKKKKNGRKNSLFKALAHKAGPGAPSFLIHVPLLLEFQTPLRISQPTPFPS